MSPEQKRTFNTIAGILFFVLGCFFIGLSVYYALHPNPPAPHPTQAAPKIDRESCIQSLQKMGFMVSDETAKKEIVFIDKDDLAQDPDIKYAKWKLDKASLGITTCKLPLKSFCMGKKCSNANNITATLDSSSTFDSK